MEFSVHRNAISSLLSFTWTFIDRSVLVLDWPCCDNRNHIILKQAVDLGEKSWLQNMIISLKITLVRIICLLHIQFLYLHRGCHDPQRISNHEYHHSLEFYSSKNTRTQFTDTKNKISKIFVKRSFHQTPYLRVSSKPSTKMMFLTPTNEYHSINVSVHRHTNLNGKPKIFHL